VSSVHATFDPCVLGAPRIVTPQTHRYICNSDKREYIDKQHLAIDDYVDRLKKCTKRRRVLRVDQLADLERLVALSAAVMVQAGRCDGLDGCVAAADR
jgi:hypothetical protein